MIPRHRERLAQTIGNAVGNELVSQETVVHALFETGFFRRKVESFVGSFTDELLEKNYTTALDALPRSVRAPVLDASPHSSSASPSTSPTRSAAKRRPRPSTRFIDRRVDEILSQRLSEMVSDETFEQALGFVENRFRGVVTERGFESKVREFVSARVDELAQSQRDARRDVHARHRGRHQGAHRRARCRPSSPSSPRSPPTAARASRSARSSSARWTTTTSSSTSSKKSSSRASASTARWTSWSTRLCRAASVSSSRGEAFEHAGRGVPQHDHRRRARAPRQRAGRQRRARQAGTDQRPDRRAHPRGRAQPGAFDLGLGLRDGRARSASARTRCARSSNTRAPTRRERLKSFLSRGLIGRALARGDGAHHQRHPHLAGRAASGRAHRPPRRPRARGEGQARAPTCSTERITAAARERLPAAIAEFDIGRIVQREGRGLPRRRSSKTSCSRSPNST